MLKSLTIFLSLLCMAYIAGCSSSPTFTTPSTLAPPPAAPTSRTVMGGAIQGVGSLVLTPTVTTFAGGSAGFSNISTSAGRNTFNRPIALTTDGTNLYVADYYNNAIRQIVIATGVVTTIAGNALGGAGSANGTGTAASFYYPSAITTDGTNLYVTDSGNYTIRKIVINSGEVSTLAGSAGLGGSLDSSVGLNARFNVLNGITTDDGTNLYVTDSNNTVRRIVINGGAVTTLAGTPGTIATFVGQNDGIGSAARFNQPAGITTDGPNLYVCDWGNSTIRKIDLASGAVTTIAGSVSPGGQEGSSLDSTDGTGNTARFDQPNGITTDGTNLYVTDSYYNKVRKIVLSPGTVSGPVTTIATNGAKDVNSTIGITTDGTSLFISSFTMGTTNHLILKIN